MSDYLFLDMTKLPDINLRFLTPEEIIALVDPDFVKHVEETISHNQVHANCIFGLQTLQQELEAIKNILRDKIRNANHAVDFKELNTHFANMVLMSKQSIAWGAFSASNPLVGWLKKNNYMDNAQKLYIACVAAGPVDAALATSSLMNTPGWSSHKSSQAEDDLNSQGKSNLHHKKS